MPSFRKTILLSVRPSPLACPRGQSLANPAIAVHAPAALPIDPLGRTTPSGSVLGFLQAAQSGDYSIAAQYLQMSAARRQSEGEQLASQAQGRARPRIQRAIGQLYAQPEGTPQEGVLLGRQKLGTMSSGDVEADLDLVRVSDPSAGKIWLISSDTLTKVPELYDQVEARQVESKTSRACWSNTSSPACRCGSGWRCWLAVPVAAAVGWLVLVLLEIPVRWWARRRGQRRDRELAIGFGARLAARRHARSSNLRRAISVSRSAAAPLLLSDHVRSRSSSSVTWIRLARRALVAAPRAQSRSGPWPRRHRIAHAAGRTHPQGSHLRRAACSPCSAASAST